MWEVKFYNGTIWSSNSIITIFEAINESLKECNLHSMDIKSVINKH